VVWDGRYMVEQLKGKWDDSFEHTFSFKAEIEKTNSGSLVDIKYEEVGKKMRLTRMFIALKACVDGFLNGCRPFLWRGFHTFDWKMEGPTCICNCY